MNYETLINALDMTTIEKMKHALETGKWADGNPLSAQEQEHCMQLILAFEQQHQPDKDLEADYNPRKQTPCASKQSASNIHIEQPLIHIKK